LVVDTATVWGEGAAPPVVALNVRVVGDTDNVAAAGVTVSETLTVDDAAPVAVIVRVPE
jgi:hypothetical protein